MNEPGACVATTDVNVYKLGHGRSAPAIGTPLANGTPMPAGSTVAGRSRSPSRSMPQPPEVTR